jgi:anaerobic selenocysteine-containing dehydrogenase
MEFKVVVEQFMTDTALSADIILPAKDIFEQSDIIGSYWSPYVQYKPKIIQSPDEVMPESEIYFHLAKQMGMDIHSEKLPEPGNENIERWLTKRIAGYSELTLADLKNGPVIAPGLQHIAWEDMKFETPSGKIELYSEEASRVWRISPLPEFVALPDETSGNKYTLRLLTPNRAGTIHSQFGNLKVIKSIVQQPAVMLSPHDAEKKGISDGQKIRMFNECGEIVSIAGLSNRIPAGTVLLYNGIWTEEGGGGNTLISGRETDIGFGAAFHDNMVEIEKTD